MKTLRLFGVALVLALTLAAAQLSGLTGALPTAHAAYSIGHDNTTNPAHADAWTHGDPNTGDAPGFGSFGNGYYYLKAYAAGNNVFCEVYTGGTWLIQLETSSKHVLSQLRTVNTGGRVFITNGHAGALYFCRISDVGTQPLRDYAELNSGPTGNTTTSDCGGPGPVWDPNFDEIPMEPAPTAGMPINGCNGHPGAAPYVAGDPRLSPPPAQTAALGPIKGGAVYAFTISGAACDLSAGAFYGHQGTRATLTITDTSGAVVNGVKWGAMESNPRSETQEFVGADAGVLAPGTYDVHYAGPANNQDVYAICQGS
jgi:hypothetical protein